MRIALIGDMTQNPQSNGKLIVKELMRQGYDVLGVDRLLPSAQIFKKVARIEPEVVIGTHTHKTLTPKVTEQIKELPSRPVMVLWYADGYSPLGSTAAKHFVKTKGLYDLSIIAVKGLLEDFEEMDYSEWVIWLPQYFDNNFFVPTIRRTDEYDVCYLGNVYPSAKNRLEFIEVLRSRFKVITAGRCLGSYAYGIDCANIHMRSKIAIDIPTKLPTKELFMSDRIYRAMGHGCLFLSQKVEGLEQLFLPGIHLDVYDNTIEGLCAKIEYYLARPKRLKKIAEAGRQEILMKHTIGYRVKQYLKAVEHIMEERHG